MENRHRTRVAIISNAPSPYRVDHYMFLQKEYLEYEFFIIFARKSNQSDIRQWEVSTEELQNVSFLQCHMFLKKGKYDDRQIFITYGVSKTLKKIKPDVVVSMEYNSTSLQAMNWCKKNEIAYVNHTDGTLLSERNISFIQKTFRKYIIRNATTFIASSTKAKEKILSYGTTKPIYLSFISAKLDDYYSIKEYDNKIKQLIYVGSLIERKGVDLLLNALAQVNSEIKLVVVGAGGQNNYLKSLSKELKIDDRVEFCGYKQRNEIIELYKQSSVFVLPTREDCYGLVILEAMATSLPIICSKYADGAYDLIHDGVDGVIIDPMNTVEFANAIEDSFKNNINNCMGKKAFENAHQFDFSHVSVGYVNAIHDAIQIKR